MIYNLWIIVDDYKKTSTKITSRLTVRIKQSYHKQNKKQRDGRRLEPERKLGPHPSLLVAVS